MKVTPREKRRHAAGREKNFLSPRRVSPFLAWGDFHARSRFARSTIPEEKWGTTRSLLVDKPRDFKNHPLGLSCLSSRSDIYWCHQLPQLTDKMFGFQWS